MRSRFAASIALGVDDIGIPSSYLFVHLFFSIISSSPLDSSQERDFCDVYATGLLSNDAAISARNSAFRRTHLAQSLEDRDHIRFRPRVHIPVSQ
jgi:hypothetical protein